VIFEDETRVLSPSPWNPDEVAFAGFSSRLD
jgi:hypothetical protein